VPGDLPLEPGREADALVARKIFGLEVERGLDGPLVVEPAAGGVAARPRSVSAPDAYTTEDRAADEIVRRFGRYEFRAVRAGSEWYVAFGIFAEKEVAPTIQILAQSVAATRSLAICEAGLLLAEKLAGESK